MGLGQQQLHAAVAEHVGQAFGGVVRVQGHVGATGLDDCQKADQQLRRTFGGDGHAHVRPDALVPQVVGQAVGLGVQFGKAQLPAVPDQRGAFRALAQLFVQALRQPLLGRRAGGHAPLLQLRRFGVAEQRQVAQGAVRLQAGMLQQADEMPGQTLDAGRVEQLVGVVEGQAQAAVAVLFAVQLQVELGLAAVPRQLFGQQPRQAAQGTEVALLVVEHDLEQALLTGFGEGFEQLFERQVLVGLGLQGGAAGLLQQVGEGLARIQLPAQYLGVDEKAQKALGLQARAVGVGHTDADIALPAVAVQQGLERRQQQHERRGLPSLGGLAHGFTEARAQAQVMARGAVADLGRTRVVGGEVQHRGFVRQLLFPVVQLALAFALGQPLALPAAVVGVLQGQGRQLQALALGRGGIEPRELVDQHIQRPAVGDDVVQGQQQLVFFVIQAHQGRPVQRPLLQIELGPGLVFADLPRPGFTLGRWQVADIDHLQVEFAGGIHLLQGLAVTLEEARAQRFVALDQLLEAGAQGLFIQLATQAQAAGNVVGAALRVQLPGDPQAVLRQGLGQRLLARQGVDAALGHAAVLLQARHGSAEGTQGRSLEQQAQAQFQPQLFTQAGDHLGSGNRVAPQEEEVIVGGH